jgi:lysophospholipase L1-like esterase
MVFPKSLALLLVAAFGLSAQSGFYLRDGDRVVFYGDSITDQRLYTVFTEAFAVTRFPTQNVTFVHSGWGGDRVSGGGGGPIDLRLDRDVIAYKPTVLTIMLGMNDGNYKAFDPSTFDTYTKGYEHILDVVQGALPKVRITAIQPSPFDDVTQPVKFDGGYNAVLLHFSKFIRDLAVSIRIDTADLNTPVVAALKKANETDPAGAKKLIPDRVHPGPAGHLLMAEALLKAWRAPAVVSDVELNMRTHHIDKAANADVTDWKGGSWTVTEKALPMPIDWKDPSTVLAVNSSDFVQALDQEILKIDGLHAGKWQLNIDDHAAGTFSSEELGAGINLVKLDTPMMQQAATVLELTRKHTQVHNVRWRDIQVPLAAENTPGKDAALKALDQLEAELVQQQRAAAQPVAHKFEIVSQP